MKLSLETKDILATLMGKELYYGEKLAEFLNEQVSIRCNTCGGRINNDLPHAFFRKKFQKYEDTGTFLQKFLHQLPEETAPEFLEKLNEAIAPEGYAFNYCSVNKAYTWERR